MTSPKQLTKRHLGQDGPEVPRLGLGLLGASGTYGTPRSHADRLTFLDQAYTKREIFWDTGEPFLRCFGRTGSQ